MPQTCSQCSTAIPEDAAHCPSCGAIAPTAVSAEARTVPFMPSAQDSSPEAVQAKLTRALGPNYEVKRVVGRGGFAAVYELWDKNLERQLAAKVLTPEVAWTPGTLERFKQEARTVARLSHPCILPIHFVGDGEDLAFYVMPFVEGQSLKDLLKDGKLPTGKIVEIGKQILDALAHAHDDEMVHRDIKPDNVMLDGKTGRALLVDFGIAKALDPRRASNMTQAGFAIGTPHYMSPEQTLGDPIDGRSDLYSFGVMLYEMATGRKPFDGETSQAIVAKHIADSPPDPVDVEATVPPWLSAVVLRCMEKKPDDRYQSAAEIVEALETGSVASATGAVGDVLGGEIIQGSGFDNDELFVFAPPPDEEALDGETDEPPAAADGANTAEPVAAHEAGSDRQVTSEPPPIELEEVKPPRPEAPESEAEVAAPDPVPETPVEHETVAEPPRKQTMAGDRARVAPKKSQKKGSSRGLLVAASVVAVLGVGALGAGFAGFGPVALQDFVRGVLGTATGGASIGPSPNRIILTNSLIEPVDLLVDGEIDRTIQPGARTSLPLSGHVGANLSWQLVRPVGPGGSEMGQDIARDLVARAETEGSRQYVIGASSAGNRVFAPLINNFSNRDIVVQVASGNGSERCNCVVPAGSRREQIGYYRLSSDSRVSAFDAANPYMGTSENVVDVFNRVDAISGVVEVTFRNP